MTFRDDQWEMILKWTAITFVFQKSQEFRQATRWAQFGAHEELYLGCPELQETIPLTSHVVGISP